MLGRPIVVVLGMHRSGTSAVTRGLAVLGVHLGDELYPPAVDNPKGFWEDSGCLALNERLLTHMGSGYDVLGFPTKLTESLRTDAGLDSLLQDAAHLIRERVNQADLYGFKDPRTSRLLPFWKEVFRRADCVPAFVIAVRNPMSVAASLNVRNGIEATKAHLLWLEHMASALIESRGFRRIVVDYDRFMDDPRRELLRVAETLGLEVSSERAVAIREFSEDFLDGKLRHTRYTLIELAQSPDVPGDVVRLYEVLQGVAEDNVDVDDAVTVAALEDLWNRINDFAPAFRYLARLEERCASLHGAVAGRDEHIAELSQIVAERDRQVTAASQMLADREGQIAWLNQAMGERDRQIEQLRACHSMRLGSALLAPFRSLRNLTTSRR
jgi:hypothetical protein